MMSPTDSNSPPPTLAELMQHAGALPSLPEIVQHLIRSLENEDADVDTLVFQINTDPVIVARLLGAANSSATGLSTRVESARQAFLVLGVDRVVNIILATSLLHRYDAKQGEFDARQLWKHTLAVATCARVVAEHCRIDAELAFTAGLLHDIGQLLMFAAAPQHYLHALELCKTEDLTILEAEQRIFDFDHAVAGSLLAQDWQLPGEIADAIAAHHDPEAHGNGNGSQLGDLIHISEVLSHALDLGSRPHNRVPDISDHSQARLGLSWQQLSGRFGEIGARYDGICVALGV